MPTVSQDAWIFQKHDNLEAVVWQLYDAGFRPSIKYGAGRLSWVSLTSTSTPSSSRASR